MNRIIIENRTDVPDADVVRMVATVIDQGRISNGGKQYCYATRFASLDIFTVLNGASDRFVAVDNKGTSHE